MVWEGQLVLVSERKFERVGLEFKTVAVQQQRSELVLVKLREDSVQFFFHSFTLI